MLRLVLLILVFSGTRSFAADLALDPTFLNLKVYKFAVSSSPLCTDLVTIIDNTNPSYTNVLDSPTFGTGTVTNGTYPCVVIEFADNIKYAPNATSDSGNCVSGTEYTLDVCSSGTSQLIDGTTTTCDSSENIVAMYLSTTSTSSSGSDGFKPPTQLNDASYGFTLANSLVVSGAVTGTFTVNGTDRICDTNDSSCDGSSNSCEMGVPAFSFAQ